MRRITAIAYALVLCVTASAAFAGECTNPNALGTSRTLAIDNTSHLKLGAQQYNETLPLADREVVLTFDDGPLGPYTTRILDLLAAECVKATYFLVGTMAQSNPALVKRILKEGHTVGSHSLNHPLTFDTMPLPNAERQIDGGIALVQAALGDQGKLAPFFRIPGLMRSNAVENLLAQRSLVTWSVDLVADDWHRGITADEIAQRALRRIAARGRGILLLHDIHPATALAMPAILRGLKAGGYRIVHVVPAAPSRPATYSEPQQWAAHGRRSRIVIAEGILDPGRPVPSKLQPRTEIDRSVHARDGSAACDGDGGRGFPSAAQQMDRRRACGDPARHRVIGIRHELAGANSLRVVFNGRRGLAGCKACACGRAR